MLILRRLSIWVTVALCCASPFVVFLALPTFDGGLFRQVETVGVGIHLLASLGAFCLLSMSIASPENLRAGWNPGVASLAFIALVGAVLSVFSDYVPRTYYGSMEHGVGVLWFAETAILTSVFSVAWTAAPKARAAMAAAPTVTVLACAVLQSARLKHGGALLVPYDFPEYLGIDALLAAVPLLALTRRWAFVLAVAVAVTCVAISGNRGAALALVAIAVLTGVLAFKPRTSALMPTGAVAFVLVTVICLAVGAPFLQSMATLGVDARTAPNVASHAPIDHVAIQNKPYGTLWQRSVTTRVVLRDLASHPLEFIVGRGFGSFETVAEEGARSAPGRRMVAPTDTASLTYWDADQKAKFHSHNQAVESLLSNGAFGLAAWLILVWLVAGRVRGKTTYGATALLGVLCVALSLWFFVNATAPLFAVAIASIFAGKRDLRPLGPTSAALATLVAAMIGLAAAGSAAMSFTALRGERLERYFLPLPVFTCQGYSALTLPNRDINRNLFKILVRRVDDKPGAEALDELGKERYNVANYDCLIRKYAVAGDPLALKASLDARVDFLKRFGIKNEAIPALLPEDFKSWSADLDKLLDSAPGRTDYVVPYVSWLEAQGRFSDVKAVADKFSKRMSPSDPVRLWLTAQVARVEGQVDRWHSGLAASFKAGFANFFRVSREEVATSGAK